MKDFRKISKSQRKSLSYDGARNSSTYGRHRSGHQVWEGEFSQYWGSRLVTCTLPVIPGRLSDRESHAHVHVIVDDVNDNAPELVSPEEPRVCENAAPGKVRQGELFPET